MKKSLILVISFGVISATAFGATAASWAVTDNADPFGVKISVSVPAIKHTVTIYTPDSTDTTNYSNFVSTSIQVEDGTNLYTALADKTSDINNFKFTSWHASKDHFRTDDTTQDIYDTTVTVTADMTVYSKYVQTNTLYYYHSVDKKGYYVTSSHDDYGLNAQSVYYGDWIYSVDGVEGHEINCTTDSGVYKFTKNESDWTIERKVVFSATNTTWWPSGAHTHIYLESSSSSKWLTDISWTSNKYTTYIDASYTKIVITRSSSATPGWDNLYNQTVDAFVNQNGKGSVPYGKDHITFYIEDEKDNNKNKYSWW